MRLLEIWIGRMSRLFDDEEVAQLVRKGKASVLRNLARMIENPDMSRRLLEPEMAHAFLKEANRLDPHSASDQ